MSVYIADIGFTKVADHWGKSISELAFESCKTILENPTVKPDALIVSNAFSELTSSQANLGPLVADRIGLDGIEAFSVESSGASGAVSCSCCELYDQIRTGKINPDCRGREDARH